jgi:hypothetical protein
MHRNAGSRGKPVRAGVRAPVNPLAVPYNAALRQIAEPNAEVDAGRTIGELRSLLKDLQRVG